MISRSLTASAISLLALAAPQQRSTGAVSGIITKEKGTGAGFCSGLNLKAEFIATQYLLNFTVDLKPQCGPFIIKEVYILYGDALLTTPEHITNPQFAWNSQLYVTIQGVIGPSGGNQMQFPLPTDVALVGMYFATQAVVVYESPLHGVKFAVSEAEQIVFQ